jgi:hypothetical protein
MRYRLKDISDVSKLNLNKTIMEKQILETAVEWLINKSTQGEFIALPKTEWIKQAKEMEKQQIMNAWKHGKMMGNSQLDFSEEYYKQQFEKL